MLQTDPNYTENCRKAQITWDRIKKFIADPQLTDQTIDINGLRDSIHAFIGKNLKRAYTTNSDQHTIRAKAPFLTLWHQRLMMMSRIIFEANKAWKPIAGGRDYYNDGHSFCQFCAEYSPNSVYAMGFLRV